MTRFPPRATTHRPIRSPGKTTFLKYTLVRLLAARQIVLLCDNEAVFLFYKGQVYRRSNGFNFRDVPRHKSLPYCPIWALIDVDFKNEGPPVNGDLHTWPIQVSSPNPVRWHSWKKHLPTERHGRD